MSDLISRKEAIEALANLTCFGIEEIKAQCYKSVSDGEEGWLGGIRDAVIEIETLPSAEPERKTGRKFLGIVVNYPKVCTYPEYEGKPYYSIKYEENGEMIVGFGTYKPEVLSQYLREYFLPSAEPDNQVHLCGFCKYGYPECPAEMSDVIFGNGIGHDNVCVCAKFEIKPERKKGKWIDEMLYQDFDESEWEKVKCSICKRFVVKQIFYHDNKYHFCPYCGAEMRGE